MGREANLWSAIVEGVTGHWVRVENMLEAGFPDVTFAFRRNGVAYEGHMELKRLKEWPRRAGTRVDPGVTVEQLRWGASRHRAGGNWLLCIGTPGGTAVLLRGREAARAAGKQYTRAQLLDAAPWEGHPGEIETGVEAVLSAIRNP